MDFSKRSTQPWRGDFFSAIGWPETLVFAIRQTHSRRIVLTTNRGPEDLAVSEADGLLSGPRGVLLTITVADCLPIFLADEATGAFALVHSGWKGTGIVCEAVEMMRVEFGTRPEDLYVTIGPGIGSCCYDVPKERYETFNSRFGGRAVRHEAGGGYFLDLAGANEILLAEAGVTRVAAVADCTSCSPYLGSFRRQGPKGFTRMLAFIGPRIPPATTGAIASSALSPADPTRRTE